MMLAGCVQYPLGMSKEQWEALPLDKKAEYQAQQAQLDEARASREAAAALERQRIAAEAARREEQRLRAEEHRLRAAYANARWGDMITVTVTGGMVAFNGKRYPYEPVAFDLIRGETKFVAFNRQGGRGASSTLIEMRLSQDGNTFTFDAPASKRVTLLNDGWERGRTYALPELGARDGHSEAIGVTLHVHLKELPGAPQRVIIERR